tara:strand:- start:222 stop:569 length:348 start_codon:yes stop_codon:yes gene_type:complete
MKNKVHIKDVKLNKYYQFGNHYHSISNYEIDLSNQAVKCIKNEIENKNKPVSFNNHHSVWLQLGWAHPELTGEWENSPMFYFPDDHQYEKIYVKEITYEKAVSLLPKGKPILATW